MLKIARASVAALIARLVGGANDLPSVSAEWLAEHQALSRRFP